MTLQILQSLSACRVELNFYLAMGSTILQRLTSFTVQLNLYNSIGRTDSIKPQGLYCTDVYVFPLWEV